METNVDVIKGWFAGRLPDGWFTGAEVTLDGDQIVVVGTLPEIALAADASTDTRSGAAAGRIARFREETRPQRIAIAQEAEEKFGRPVTWGARMFETTQTFTPGGSGRGSGTSESRSVMIGHRRRLMREWRRRMAFAPFGPFGPWGAPWYWGGWRRMPEPPRRFWDWRRRFGRSPEQQVY